MTQNSVLSSLMFNLFLTIQVLISNTVYDGIHGSFRGLKIKWAVYLCHLHRCGIAVYDVWGWHREEVCTCRIQQGQEQRLEGHCTISQPCLIEHYSQRCVVSVLRDKSGTFAKLCPSVQCDSPEMRARWYKLRYQRQQRDRGEQEKHHLQCR